MTKAKYPPRVSRTLQAVALLRRNPQGMTVRGLLNAMGRPLTEMESLSGELRSARKTGRHGIVSEYVYVNNIRTSVFCVDEALYAQYQAVLDGRKPKPNTLSPPRKRKSKTSERVLPQRTYPFQTHWQPTAIYAKEHA